MFDKNFLKSFLKSSDKGEANNFGSVENNNEKYMKAMGIIDQVVNNRTDKFKNVL